MTGSFCGSTLEIGCGEAHSFLVSCHIRSQLSRFGVSVEDDRDASTLPTVIHLTLYDGQCPPGPFKHSVEVRLTGAALGQVEREVILLSVPL